MTFRAFSIRFLRIGIPALIVWALTAGVPSFGQDTADPSMLNLDRVLSPGEFAPEDSGRGRWLADSSGYTMLRPSKDVAEGQDIVRCDAASGRVDILVPAGRLIPPGATAPLRIAGYDWSSDGQRLLIQTNPKRVYHKMFADYWILDLKDGGLRKIGGNFAPSSLLNATFSPDGTHVAYVRENNIYVEDAASRDIVQLTKDGSEDILNGTFDYVTEEEFFTTHGFRWSPDGKSIAYWQMDTTKVPVFSMINNTDALYPKIVAFKFSRPGQPIAAGRIGVVGSTGGTTTWFDVPGDPAENYIQQLEWAANSNEVVFQHLNRNQNRNDVMLGDARTGGTKTIYTDSDPAWLDVVRDFQWLDGGKEFLWVSEKDGWRHVYAVSRASGETRLVTPGEFDVWEVAGVDAKGGWLYGIASPDNATQRYLYRFRLNGKGAPQRLSPADRPGTHDYDISPDASWAFHTYSTFAAPPVTKLIRLAGHKEVRTIADNSKALKNLQGLKRGAAEFLKIDIGAGVVLDAWIMRPPDFDPQKKYPAAFLRLRGALGFNRDGQLGRDPIPLASLADAERLCRHERGQPGNAGAPGPRLEEMHLRPGRHPGVGGSGRGGESRPRAGSFDRRREDRHLRIERRRSHDPQRDVPLSRRLSNGNGLRFSGGSALLQLRLPGEVHGIAEGQSPGISKTDPRSATRAGSKETCSSSTAPATTTCTTRTPRRWSTSSSSSTSRSR